MPQELKVIQDFYDFTLWLIGHTEKFPRHHRYSLGLAMEEGCRTIMGLLLRAKYAREKEPYLREVPVEIDILRFQIRQAKDLAILPFKSHEYANKALEAIGLQIGGWIRSRGRGS